MILDQLFEATDEDSTAQRVAEVLRQVHPNPSTASEREILAATSRVLTDQGMSDVQVRFYLRDPDFQSDIIEEVQARLQGVAEMDSQGYRGHRGDEDPGKGPEKSVQPAKSKDVAKDAKKELTKAMDKAHKKQGVGEAMKPSDIPPSMRDRLTMRDIEAERPAGAFRFRVTFPDGSYTDFMDFEAARASARIEQGRISRLDETQPTAARSMKRGSARIDRILHMLRARHPQAQNDLEALILDFRGQQAQDRSDIARLDAENDTEEADIERLEALLDQLRRTRSKPSMATESLRDGEYHVATVTLDDGTVKKVRITSDEGFRDQIAKHFEKQGRQVKDIDVDYSVRSDLDETKKKPRPTNPELWSRAKSAARSKFDVYPSAYANAWAAKWYKSKGGGWRMGNAKKD